MDQTIAVAASGLEAQMTRQDIIANNLANVNTTGFKRDRLILEGFQDRVAAHRQGGVRVAGTVPDFTAGSLSTTNDPLDLAINGEGFFKVETPRGVRLTQAGHFTRDAQGWLTTVEGDRVLGSNGPICLPDGPVEVGSDGMITVSGQPAGCLSVVTVSHPDQLIKEGANQWAVPAGEAVSPAPGQVAQRMLESSNASPVMEMVALVDCQRAFQANLKVLQAEDDLLGRAATELGRVRT